MIREEKNPMLYEKIECFKTNNLSRSYSNSNLAKQIEVICLEEANHGRLSVDEKAAEKFLDRPDGDYWGVKAGVAWLQTKLRQRGECIDVMQDNLSPIYKDLEIGYFGPCIIYGLAYYSYDVKKIDYSFRGLFDNVKNLDVINSYLVSDVVLPQHHDQYLPLFRIMSAAITQERLYGIRSVEDGIHAYKDWITYPDETHIAEMRLIYMMLYKLAQYIAPAYMAQYIEEDGRPLPKWTIRPLFEFLVSYALEETSLSKAGKNSFVYTHTDDTRSYERVLNQLKRRTSSKYDKLFTKLIEEDLHLQ